jgi:hypothetical protein
MAHYNITTVATPGGVPDVLELRPPAGHAVTASPMVQTGSVTIPVETDFDDTDLEQLRLHQKPR